MHASEFVKIGIAVTGLYLFCIGGVMQFFPKLGAKKVLNMTKAIRIHAHGGPEVLRYEEVEPARPGKGEVLIRHTAIGLNFLDVYYRTGLYPAPDGLPLIPGSEAAGVVLEVGEGVDWPEAGDRVAYAGPLGAYAEQRVIAADRLVKIPDGVSDEQAAAMMLKGMTAEYPAAAHLPVKPGDTCSSTPPPAASG